MLIDFSHTAKSVFHALCWEVKKTGVNKCVWQY